MVFGNMGNDCATGVVFTRNPSDGTKDIYGEYLINAQGEDVVAGTRPSTYNKKSKKKSHMKELSMEETMPSVYKKLEKILFQLEKHYKDMQELSLLSKIIIYGCCKQDLEEQQNLLLKLQLRWLMKK